MKMEMEMKMKDNGKKASTGGMHTPEIVVKSKGRENKGELEDVAELFVNQFPHIKEDVRELACSCCHFAKLAIVPFVHNKTNTMAIEYRCSERHGILGHLFIHESGEPWLGGEVPETCSILINFKEKISAAAAQIDVTKHIREAIKALWNKDNKRFAKTPQQIHGFLPHLYKNMDCKTLFAYENDFETFFKAIENGEVVSPVDANTTLPARNAVLMNEALRSFMDSDGRDIDHYVDYEINKEVLYRVNAMRAAIRTYTTPYHTELARPEGLIFYKFNPFDAPENYFSDRAKPKLTPWDKFLSNEPYTYVPPELDDDEREAGFVTFDVLYPAFKGRQETA